LRLRTSYLSHSQRQENRVPQGFLLRGSVGVVPEADRRILAVVATGRFWREYLASGYKAGQSLSGSPAGLPAMMLMSTD
jgi:hypothetical protein